MPAKVPNLKYKPRRVVRPQNETNASECAADTDDLSLVQLERLRLQQDSVAQQQKLSTSTNVSAPRVDHPVALSSSDASTVRRPVRMQPTEIAASCAIAHLEPEAERFPANTISKILEVEPENHNMSIYHPIPLDCTLPARLKSQDGEGPVEGDDLRHDKNNQDDGIEFLKEYDEELRRSRQANLRFERETLRSSASRISMETNIGRNDESDLVWFQLPRFQGDQQPFTLTQLPPGKVGEIRVYKSGRMVMEVCGVHYDVGVEGYTSGDDGACNVVSAIASSQQPDEMARCYQLGLLAKKMGLRFWEDGKDKEMTSTGKSVKKEKFWLYAFRDHLAGIQAFSNAIDVADIYGEGDYKLIIADAGRRLKVFGGTSLVSELRLFFVPSAVSTFYSDNTDIPHRPVVAVACGPYIYMYLNMKPFYRFTVDLVELDEVDKSVWEALRNGAMSVAAAAEALGNRRANGVELSTRSTEFLACNTEEDQERFVENFKDKELRQLTIVTCMSSIWLNSMDEGASSCLVFGTESRYIYILKSSGAAVHLRVRIPAVPTCLLTAGSLRVDYRIIMACRDGCVYSIKNDRLSNSVIFPDGSILQIARYDNLVAIATSQNTLSFYSIKGKRQSSIILPLPVMAISTITENVTGRARGIIVALSNGAIRVYVGKTLLHESQVYGTVTAMRFGRYGREDAALMLVLQNGSLVVEMLHRHASFPCENAQEVGPPSEQDIPIPVPPLTSVFVAQAERERSYSLDIHRSFQRDLCRMRLNTAKLYLSMVSEKEELKVTKNGTSMGGSPRPLVSTLRMITAVQGLGPIFKIRITLQNTNEKPMHNLTITARCHPSSCVLPKPMIVVPFLPPSILFSYEVPVERLRDDVTDGEIRFCVSTPSTRVPLAVAVLDLPHMDINQGCD